MSEAAQVVVRGTRAEDIPRLLEMSRAIYPARAAWTETELRSHLSVFPEGQLVAELGGRVLGMAASVVILWDDYDIRGSWRQFTGDGLFTNHDPVNGRTLYGAGVMVDPEAQGRGVGRALYAARRALTRRLELSRIRAGARLSRYARYADRMTARDYVAAVLDGEIRDPVLHFQVREGFRVLAVVPGYLPHDPESLGYAAVIEWLNPEYRASSAAPSTPR